MVADESSFKRLIDIGIALSAEKNPDRLMETILLEAKSIGSADAGTLYIRTKQDQLTFARSEPILLESLRVAPLALKSQCRQWICTCWMRRDNAS